MKSYKIMPDLFLCFHYSRLAAVKNKLIVMFVYNTLCF